MLLSVHVTFFPFALLRFVAATWLLFRNGVRISDSFRCFSMLVLHLVQFLVAGQ